VVGVSVNFEGRFKKIIALPDLSQFGLMARNLSLDLSSLAFFRLLTLEYNGVVIVGWNPLR
jgi:hypothetical protein